MSARKKLLAALALLLLNAPSGYAAPPPAPAAQPAAQVAAKQDPAELEAMKKTEQKKIELGSYAADGTLLFTSQIVQPGLFRNSPVFQPGDVENPLRLKKFYVSHPALKPLDDYLTDQQNEFYYIRGALEAREMKFYQNWRETAGAAAVYNGGYTQANRPKGDLAGLSFVKTTKVAQGAKTISFVTHAVKNLHSEIDDHTYAATFDKATGERLTLSGLFGGDDVTNRIANYAGNYFPASPYQESLQSDWGRHLYDFCYTPGGDGWYIDGNNLVITYLPDTVCDSDRGSISVAVPLEELGAK